MPTVQAPDGTEIEFPDDMPVEKIREVMRKKFPPQKPLIPPQAGPIFGPPERPPNTVQPGEEMAALGTGMKALGAVGGAGIGLATGGLAPVAMAGMALAGSDLADQAYRSMAHGEPMNLKGIGRAAATGIGATLGGAGVPRLMAPMLEGAGPIAKFLAPALAGTTAAGLGSAGAGAGVDLAMGDKISPESVALDAAGGSLGHIAGGIDAGVRGFAGAKPWQGAGGAKAGIQQYFTGTPDEGVSVGRVLREDPANAEDMARVARLTPDQQAHLKTVAAQGQAPLPTTYDTTGPARTEGISALDELLSGVYRDATNNRSAVGKIPPKAEVPPLYTPKTITPEAVPTPTAREIPEFPQPPRRHIQASDDVEAGRIQNNMNDQARMQKYSESKSKAIVEDLHQREAEAAGLRAKNEESARLLNAEEQNTAKIAQDQHTATLEANQAGESKRAILEEQLNELFNQKRALEGLGASRSPLPSGSDVPFQHGTIPDMVEAVTRPGKFWPKQSFGGLRAEPPVQADRLRSQRLLAPSSAPGDLTNPATMLRPPVGGSSTDPLRELFAQYLLSRGGGAALLQSRLKKQEAP